MPRKAGKGVTKKKGAREERGRLHALREADPRASGGDYHPTADEAGAVRRVREERIVKQND